MRGAKMIRAPAIPRCSASRRRFCPAAELMLEILLSEDQIRVAAARARAGLARRDVRRFDHVTLMRGAAAFAVATNALAVSCEANQAPAPSA